jgi:hypothetical protein
MTMSEMDEADMRLLGTITVLAGLAPGMVPGLALAQDFVPVNPETVASYCYYEGATYSVGARLCIPGTQGGYTLVCKSAIEDTDAAKTGRAVWRFDVGPPAPLCGPH